jgi:hypothetical protein
VYDSVGDDAVGDVGPLVHGLPWSDLLLKRVQIREDGWMQATAPLDTALVSAAAKFWLKMHGCNDSRGKHES